MDLGNHQSQFEKSRMGRAVQAMSTGVVDPAQLPAWAHWMRNGYWAFSRDNYAQAFHCFSQVLATDPQNQDALNGQGGALIRLNRYEDALEAYAQLLALNPAHVDGLSNCGFALLQLEMPEQALACLDKALGLRPGNVTALNNRGLALRALGRLEDALQCLDQALATQPQHLQALNNRGLVLQALGRHDEALHCFDDVLRLRADHVEALVNRGLALHQLGRHAEALVPLDSVLRAHPDHFEALSNRGAVLQALGRQAEALACFERLAALHVESPALLRSRGSALYELGRFREALDCHERALALKPDDAELLRGYASALFKLGRYEEALGSLDRALAREPDNAVAWSLRGYLLERLYRRTEALTAVDRSLALSPQFTEARFNRSLTLLAMGRLEEGFREYEARWNCTHFEMAQLPSSAPQWRGEPLADASVVLLWAEQGFGDTLQFVRYAPMVAALGAQVVLRAPAPLLRLLRSVQGVAQCISNDDPLPAHQFHCPLMSLPALFGTRLDNIPASVPYLCAEPAAVRHWADRLGPRSRLRIGVAWAGRQASPIIWGRDLPLPTLRPLLELDAQFVSLQKEVPAQDRAAMVRLPQLAAHGETLSDFADAAGLIENLDLVISVDTSVAHLAGALGKPLWLLNRYSPCWRWLEGRPDSPWYPTARLFRQRSMADWVGVVEEVTRATRALIQARMGAGT